MMRIFLLSFISLSLAACEPFIKSLDLQFDPEPEHPAVQPQIETVDSQILGRGLGQPVQRTDLQFAYQALHKPMREKTVWRNDQTEVEFSVKPTSGWKTVDDVERCRDFITTILYRGHKHQYAGIACLKLNGEWEALS